jgi:signal transduction histidine kinase
MLKKAGESSYRDLESLTGCHDTPARMSVVDRTGGVCQCPCILLDLPMKLHLARMTAALAVGTTLAVATAFGTGAFFYSQHHLQMLVRTAREGVLAQGELISEALEHLMIANNRSLIAQMVESFGRQASVRALLLLDRQGLVQFSSGPVAPGTDLSIESPTCQACHALPPGERTLSRVIDASDGTLLRAVVPFRNREACHGCHDPSQGINGILIVDRDVGELRAAMNRDLRLVAAGGGGLTLLFAAGIAVLVRAVLLRDIAERRAAEARLAESHRLASLGMLASGFSHELNTPLGPVLMCVEGILREARTNEGAGMKVERIGEAAAIARDQILRCRGITQHFLRLSRGQSSPGDIVDVGSAVTAVARLVEPTAQAHSVQIRVEPFVPELRVRADEAELQHTLVNLLLNAIQACTPGGTVVVEAAADTVVHIRVRDDGCGITPDNVKRIFEPFFSLRSGGTGLGLFLSLSFVRRWGGDIRVESAPDQGSTFEIVLPAVTGSAGQEAVS